jgi:hypothetical protein
MPGSTETLAPISAPVHHHIDWARSFSTVLGENSGLTHGSTMSTIGLPLYLAKSDTEYFNAAAANNSGIWSRFSELLEAMIETLESLVRVPITYDARLALPGFHIFKSCEAIPFNGGVWHVDVFRYEVLPTPLVSYSATLLLGDTKTSYGINYRAGDHATHYFQHQIGAITFFNSALPHRVAPIYLADKPGTRVTCQAHVAASKKRGMSLTSRRQRPAASKKKIDNAF